MVLILITVICIISITSITSITSILIKFHTFGIIPKDDDFHNKIYKIIKFFVLEITFNKLRQSPLSVNSRVLRINNSVYI